MKGGRVRIGLARRLLDDDGPAERRDASGHAELAAAVFVQILPRHRRVAELRRSRSAYERVVEDVAHLSDERLFVRVAVREQLPVRCDDHREPVGADANLIDHPPHLFEPEFADQPAGGLTEACEMNGEIRRRQQVVVNPHGRHGDAVQHQRSALGNLHARWADAARGNEDPGPPKLTAKKGNETPFEQPRPKSDSRGRRRRKARVLKTRIARTKNREVFVATATKKSLGKRSTTAT